MNVAVIVIACLICLLAAMITAAFVPRGIRTAERAAFDPLEEKIRHDTFKQSQAYRDSLERDLQDYWMAYLHTDPEHRGAIEAMVLRQTAGVSLEELPTHLAEFVASVRAKRTACP